MSYEPTSLFDTKGWVLAIAILDTIVALVWIAKAPTFWTSAVAVIFILLAMYNWNRLWKIRKGL